MVDTGDEQLAHHEWLCLGVFPRPWPLGSGRGRGRGSESESEWWLCLPLAEHLKCDDALSGDRLLSRLSAKETICVAVAS